MHILSRINVDKLIQFISDDITIEVNLYHGYMI